MSGQQAGKSGGGSRPMGYQGYGSPQGAQFGMNPMMPFGYGGTQFGNRGVGNGNRNFSTQVAPPPAPTQAAPASPQSNPWAIQSATQPGPNYQWMADGMWALPGGYGPSPYGEVNGYGAPMTAQQNGQSANSILASMWPEFFNNLNTFSAAPPPPVAGNPAASSTPTPFGGPGPAASLMAGTPTNSPFGNFNNATLPQFSSYGNYPNRFR